MLMLNGCFRIYVDTMQNRCFRRQQSVKPSVLINS